MTIKNRSSFEFYYEKHKSLQINCSNKSYRFRHSTVRNLRAGTRNLICTAKHGTFKKVLENISYHGILWEGISLYVQMTNWKENVNIQYVLKTDRSSHVEAKFFAISFFLFLKKRNSATLFYSTDHWTYKQLQYMPVLI